MTRPTTPADVRQCMNCGRPQDHRRWHEPEPDPPRLLSNGCPAFMAQPETLWRAVLWPAIQAAAYDAGVVDSMQVFRELDRQWGR
jgi:hypothetical protein